MQPVLIGVRGSGKSRVGKILARELGWTFVETDDFHPAAHIEKMRSGIPRWTGLPARALASRASGKDSSKVSEVCVVITGG